MENVPGLTVERSWIDEEEEDLLLACVDEEPWSDDFKRRVQQYGFGYGGEASRYEEPEWVRDIPFWLAELGERLVAEGHLPRFCENVVVNDYAPGVGIGPHRDYPPFGDAIACVSLGDDVVMDFSEPRSGARAHVLVPRRSLWVASGEARWRWLHAIRPRLTDVVGGERRRRRRRVSITFRTLREAPGVVTEEPSPRPWQGA